jgi:epoxyqueuosine reductase
MAMGFNMVGVIPAAPGRRLDAYLAWMTAEMNGAMGYMARPDRVARRKDLNVILPGVQSIVCVGLDYSWLSPPAAISSDPGRGRISNYAWGVDYHDVMLPRLEALAAWLCEATGDRTVQSKAYVDTGAILERDHAETSGLGFTGKNTMLIHPGRGSWFFLGELLTTLPLNYDTPRPMPSCGTCRNCLDACPTAAFPQPYVLDARRCISYLTIELKGWIPHELRPLMGNWIYGCDVCQVVCPFNRFAPGTAEPTFRPPDWDTAAPPLLDLLTLDEEGFRRRFAGSPIQRIKRRGLLRNACVAAGNWGDPAAIPALAALLSDPEPLIRGHAAWALHQIRGEAGQSALQAALPYETDYAVLREMNNETMNNG